MQSIWIQSAKYHANIILALLLWEYYHRLIRSECFWILLNRRATWEIYHLRRVRDKVMQRGVFLSLSLSPWGPRNSIFILSVMQFRLFSGEQISVEGLKKTYVQMKRPKQMTVSIKRSDFHICPKSNITKSDRSQILRTWLMEVCHWAERAAVSGTC